MSTPAGGTPAPAAGRPAERPRVHRPPASMVTVIWRSLAVFILLLLAAATLIYLGISGQARVVRRVVQQLEPLRVANAQVRADFAESQAALHAYIDTGEGRFSSLEQASRGRLAADLATALTLAGGPARAELTAQQRAARAWYGYAGRLRALPPRSPALIRLSNQAAEQASAFYAANSLLHRRLQGQARQEIDAGRRNVARSIGIAGILAGVALLLGIIVAVLTVRRISLPLQGVTATLERLTSGDHAARAPVAGAAETRQAAFSLNALADETDRLRTLERERGRLGTLAREAGLRIREHLRAEDVLGEARAVLEQELNADAAYLHLVEAGRLGLPLGHEHDWLMPREFLGLLGPQFLDLMSAMFSRRQCLVVQDIGGPEAAQIPPEFKEPQLRAGIVAQIVVPFGVGADLLGIVVLSRLRKGSPWTAAEVDAVESIVTDLGRGLQHARMYEAENKLVAELRALDRMKSDFLATVSHELRTPLTSIAGFVELLRDQGPGPLNREQQSMLATVDRNTARLRHLIEDVLTLSKIESRAFKTSMQPVDLAEIAAAAAEALQPEAAARELSLTSSGAGPLLVSGDAGQLDRMVINLLSNAVKFTPPGGRVEVRAGRADGMAAVAISDTGIGIPERDQRELFTRFFRASNATERSIPGTGLGLTIVHAIVANHGGELSLRSREGRGTTVTARIPLLTARGVVIAPHKAGRPGPDSPAAGDGPAPGGAPAPGGGPPPGGPGPAGSRPGDSQAGDPPTRDASLSVVRLQRQPSRPRPANPGRDEGSAT